MLDAAATAARSGQDSALDPRSCVILDGRIRDASWQKHCSLDAFREERRFSTEVWFAGVHSDVGGTFRDKRLADTMLAWMVAEAQATGLNVDADAFEKANGTPLGKPMEMQHYPNGDVHHAGRGWLLTGKPHDREILTGDWVHHSVFAKRDKWPGDESYLPKLPDEYEVWESNP